MIKPVGIAVAVLVLSAGMTGPASCQAVRNRSAPMQVRTAGQAQIQFNFEDVAERRARIGIIIGMEPHETDSLGAVIDAVSPGGPADRVGIRSGDIITKIDGVAIGSTAERPGLRLSQAIAHLEPNDTIAVEFYRNHNRRTVSVVAAPAMSVTFTNSADDSARNLIALLASPLADLSLAPLNPELGQYFGTTEGVLVISSPPEAKLGLKGGDVILSINDRKITNPDRVLRLLRTRQQPLALEVLRSHRRIPLRIPADTTGR